MGTQVNTPPADNYAAFILRLEAAASNLGKRAKAVDKAVSSVSLLLEKYQVALLGWERRRARVSEELDRYSGEPQTYATLAELHDTAVKMVSTRRTQALRIAEKLRRLQAQREAVGQSLRELEASRAKLTSARRLSRDRENLNRVIYQLAGPRSGPTTPDQGLRNDLREARQAVILAEALMEVKGT